MSEHDLEMFEAAEEAEGRDRDAIRDREPGPDAYSSYRHKMSGKSAGGNADMLFESMGLSAY